jgi:hypothetical protein
LAALTQRLSRCPDLDDLLTEALAALDDLFGFDHSMLLMLDEAGGSLYTIASRGYERSGIGAEVPVGQGIIGMVAARERLIRVGNLTRMVTYARAVRRSSRPVDDRAIPMPGLAAVGSQLAGPVMVQGHLLGVLAVESEELGAFSSEDESLLVVLAHLVANGIELDRVASVGPPTERERSPLPLRRALGDSTTGRNTTIWFFPTDGSIFVDRDYLIKGVAGRILWRLLSDYKQSGRTEFSNREVRLDKALELPAYRDNLESRLILLKRRLEERKATIRIEKNGRGRFRLVIHGTVHLERREDT